MEPVASEDLDGPGRQDRSLSAMRCGLLLLAVWPPGTFALKAALGRLANTDTATVDTWLPLLSVPSIALSAVLVAAGFLVARHPSGGQGDGHHGGLHLLVRSAVVVHLVLTLASAAYVIWGPAVPGTGWLLFTLASGDLRHLTACAAWIGVFLLVLRLARAWAQRRVTTWCLVAIGLAPVGALLEIVGTTWRSLVALDMLPTPSSWDAIMTPLPPLVHGGLVLVQWIVALITVLFAARMVRRGLPRSRVSA